MHGDPRHVRWQRSTGPLAENALAEQARGGGARPKTAGTPSSFPACAGPLLGASPLGCHLGSIGALSSIRPITATPGGRVPGDYLIECPGYLTDLVSTAVPSSQGPKQGTVPVAVRSPTLGRGRGLRSSHGIRPTSFGVPHLSAWTPVPSASSSGPPDSSSGRCLHLPGSLPFGSGAFCARPFRCCHRPDRTLGLRFEYPFLLD